MTLFPEDRAPELRELFFESATELLQALNEEGLDSVVARHRRLAEATRRAVRAWSGNQGPQLYCLNPARASDSVTAVLMPDGHDANAVPLHARGLRNPTGRRPAPQSVCTHVADTTPASTESSVQLLMIVYTRVHATVLERARDA